MIMEPEDLISAVSKLEFQGSKWFSSNPSSKASELGEPMV